MKTNNKGKIMPFLITLVLLLSMVIIVPQTMAAEEWDLDEFTTHDLTSGEQILVKASGLTANTRYYIGIKNESGNWTTSLGNGKADSDRDFSKTINVPFREVGSYDMALFNSNTLIDANIVLDNITIWVNHSYRITYEVGTTSVDYVLFNKTYEGAEDRLKINIDKWTGSKYESLTEDVVFTLYNPDGTKIDDAYTNETIDLGTWPIEYTFDFRDGNNLENSYWVYAELEGDTDYYTNTSLPVKLEMVDTEGVNNYEWGDTINIEGYLKTGDNTGAYPYSVALFGPHDDTYQLVRSSSTMSSGWFNIAVNSEDFSAGTWYLGTYMQNSEYRVNETTTVKNFTGNNNFIMYDSFNVNTKTDAVGVSLESPEAEEIVQGFTKTFNVSVQNIMQDDEDWENGYHTLMKIHIDDIDFYLPDTREKHHDYDDPVEIIETGNVIGEWGWTDEDEDHEYAYYSFNITFNETATNAKIIVTYDENNSFYDDAENDIFANIIASAAFSVTEPDDITIMIESDSDEVNVDEVTGKTCCWQNKTNYLSVTVYGDNQTTFYNATAISIIGAGLDLEFDEEDLEDYYQSEGVYKIPFQPKIGGVVTVTVTAEDDDEDEYTRSKDYDIDGLTGHVTTSVGDDLEITVGTSEDIIVHVDGGTYAEVHLCYVPHEGDEVWDWSPSNIVCLDEIAGDGTEGKGAGGDFQFEIEADDLDEGVGWIVVAAKAGPSLYMYDIIEVAPVWDLVFELVEPVNVTDPILTVGIEVEGFLFEIYDSDGELIDDIDEITGLILDENGKEKQSDIELIESGDGWEFDEFVPMYAGELVLTAVNNSGGDEHRGEYTMDIGHATITYSPSSVTCGIGLENITIDLVCVDALGDPLPDGTSLILNIENDTGLDGINDGEEITVEDGEASFKITTVGDIPTTINITIEEAFNESDVLAYRTNGEFGIDFPMFTLNPATIYLNQENLVEVIAKNAEGDAIQGIYLTFYGFATNPDPVLTDEEGFAAFSITPQVSGKYNVSIIKELIWENNRLYWEEMWKDNNAVITDTVLTSTSYRLMDLSAPASINEGEQFTVTLTRRGTTSPVSGALVTFDAETKTTDAQGKATFTAPSVRANLNYHITATATGYVDATATILIINLPQIYLSVPEDAVVAGEKFEVVAGGDDGNNAGIQVTFQGETKITSATGTVTFTAPTEEGTYQVTATKEGYMSADPAEVEVTSAGIPGFEVLTLLAALGVAFILLKRRRN
jgi:hypothetical protein